VRAGIAGNEENGNAVKVAPAERFGHFALAVRIKAVSRMFQSEIDELRVFVPENKKKSQISKINMMSTLLPKVERNKELNPYMNVIAHSFFSFSLLKKL
jgi:hypothetical protein